MDPVRAIKRQRCDAIVVQLIVTQYDEYDRPLGEVTSQPLKIFRAATPDVWRAVDAAVTQHLQPSPPPPPTPAPPVRPKKGQSRG